MVNLEQVGNDLNLALQSLQELREKYDGALDLLDNKNTEITGALNSAKSNALQEIQTISNTATSQISQLKDTSLNTVNEAKNTATSEITNKKQEHQQELEAKKNEYMSEMDAKANEYDIANINAQVQAMDTKITEQINGAKTELNSKIEQAKTEQESVITELKESVSTQGEKITALEQAKESITADLNKKSKLLTEKLEWTVGSGGNFENIDDAINEIYKYSKSIYDVTLKIKNGYTITRPVTIYNLPVQVNITGENGRSDELIVDLNNTNWAQFGLTITMCDFTIHDITIKAISNNSTLVYINRGANGSIYNTDLIGMSLNTLALQSSGNIEVSSLNISNNYQGDEQCFDLSTGNSLLNIGSNVNFLSNNTKNLVAIRAGTNAKIGATWWAGGINISGNYKVGLQVDGGGVIDNPSIAITGNTITKYSQTPGQWTVSGYISTNI
ncbi:TPA: hypothetical protein ACL01D_001771 [Campylobacter jejuni subsp. jejuni]